MHVMESEAVRSPYDHCELCFAAFQNLFMHLFFFFLLDTLGCEITHGIPEYVLHSTSLSQPMHGLIDGWI